MPYTIGQLDESLRPKALDNFFYSDEYVRLAMEEKETVLREVESFCNDAGLEVSGTLLQIDDNYVDINMVDGLSGIKSLDGYHEGDCYYGHLMYEWNRWCKLVREWLELAKFGYESSVEEDRNIYGGCWWHDGDASIEEYMEEPTERAEEMTSWFVEELSSTVNWWLDGCDDYVSCFGFVEDSHVLFDENGEVEAA